MKATVSLQTLADYDPREVMAALRRLLAPLGGMAAFVRPGQKVLIKPNMLAGKDPEKAVTTHPEIVRAVILLAQEAGGIVSVGDSPGVGNSRQVAERCGILPVISATGARFAPFEESVRIDPQAGSTFHQLEIARDILDAEVIINLPKLKTHQMMGMTGAVKNLYGAVVGLRKARIHLQAGADKAFFALMLLELAERLTPALSIVDAVLAMEGDGPGSGEPRDCGLLLAGAAPLAVDTVAAHLTGLDRHRLWVQEMATQTGRPYTRLDEIEIVGMDPATLSIRPFKPSRTTGLHFGLPEWLRRPLGRSLVARPVVDRRSCTACGVCVASCPPQAMALQGKSLQIDESRCILCFCCHELCPRGALHTRQGLLLRLFSRLRLAR